MVEDGAIIQIGGGVTVQPVIQPHKCTDATPHEVVEEGCAAPIDFLQTPTGREIEHSSDSVSNAKFTFRPNQVKYYSVTLFLLCRSFLPIILLDSTSSLSLSLSLNFFSLFQGGRVVSML